MTITIELGTLPAIIIACECYLDEKIKKKQIPEEVKLTVSEIISNPRLQRHWIKKGLKL